MVSKFYIYLEKDHKYIIVWIFIQNNIKWIKQIKIKIRENK